MDKTKPLSILCSHYYLRSQPVLFEALTCISEYVSILIDSGAFSNHNRRSGNPVTIDSYIKSCREYDATDIWQYIALDVIKNPEQTWSNLCKMVDAGLKPMPVFVYPEKYERLKELVEINKFICVAGGVEASKRFAIQRYQKAYKITDGRIKIHALGFVKWPHFLQVPLYSVDSSTWTGGARWGTISRFDGMRGFTIMKKGNSHSRTISYLSKINLTPAIIASDLFTSGANGVPSACTVYEYILAQFFALQYDRRLFLAVTNKSWLDIYTAILHSIDEVKFDYQEFFKFSKYLKSISGVDFIRTIRDFYEKYDYDRISAHIVHSFTQLA